MAEVPVSMGLASMVLRALRSRGFSFWTSRVDLLISVSLV